ncbi:MAG: TIGR03986 family CRISPR-associated RAMP protein [Blastochloris sp.]|nr:TIGR03986 family CRISPR-associated RAMP protein [Blastochloris sp.]
MDGDTLIFFGHTMLFRVPYANTPYDLVPKSLRSDTLDMAEALFGFVRDGVVQEGSDQIRAGRVFMSDAQPSEYTRLDSQAITPRILSGPKPTTFQHYLVQEEDAKESLKHYADQTPQDTVIRGHKLYWHKGDVGRDDIVDSDFARLSPTKQREDTQHTQFKPLAAGSRFRFEIRYENLSKVELGALLWVLDLTDDSRQDRPYRLKLGMGKPLGMGSIRLSYEIHELNPADRYTTLLAENMWKTGEAPLDRVVVDECIRDFSVHVLERCNEPTSTPEKLHGLLRIQMLLAMLSWPGPQPVEQFTRYMEIERNKTPRIGLDKNEYKQRPVLPDPLQVLNQSEGREVIRRQVANTLRDRQSTAPRPNTPQPQRQATLPKVGDVFTRPVLKVYDQYVVIEVPGFKRNQVEARLTNADMDGKRFVQGNVARVEVIAVSEPKAGRYIIDVKVAPRNPS